MSRPAPTIPANESQAATAGSRIRVAFCITDLAVGGAERALVELACRLPRAEFEPRVYALQPLADAETRSLAPALRDAGVPTMSCEAHSARDAVRVYRQLVAQWRSWRPQIVQTFLFHANLLGRLAAWQAGVPHVVSGIRVAQRGSRWRLRLDRWTDRLVDAHVCVSRSVADFSHSAGGIASEKLVVIPNGIDTARYDAVAPVSAAALGVPSGRRWITFIGRLDPQKGLEWFLNEAGHWLPKVPEHDLLLVGDGPLRAQLTELVRERGLADRVHLTGWRADIPNILAASDLLVLPSRWEGMPNVVLEAMASSRPVLASDVEGVRELLGDQAAAQVAAVGDGRQWQEKLLTLIADRPLAAQLGQANRRRVEAHFTLAAAVRQYAQLYRSLMQSPNQAISSRRD